MNERHRYVIIACPDKLGTDSTAYYGGLNKNILYINMDAAAELGRNPVSKHQIQPEYYGDGQADTGRGCRTHLARPNSQARVGTGKYPFSLFS